MMGTATLICVLGVLWVTIAPAFSEGVFLDPTAVEREDIDVIHAGVPLLEMATAAPQDPGALKDVIRGDGPIGQRSSGGNLAPTTGKREWNDSTLSQGPLENAGKTGSAFDIEDYPPPDNGFFDVFNTLNDAIAIHCSSQLADLRASTLKSHSAFSHSFPILTYITEIWTCHFKWKPPGKATWRQSFELWAHDGSRQYLWRCWNCIWKVQEDGFWIKYPGVDGQYFHVWDWIEAGG